MKWIWKNCGTHRAPDTDMCYNLVINYSLERLICKRNHCSKLLFSVIGNINVSILRTENILLELEELSMLVF